MVRCAPVMFKVDCFLNHQLDIALLDEIGKAFYEVYKNDGINKILTIEASGIAIACMTARHFGVPVVFAKKAKSRTSTGMCTPPPFTPSPTARTTTSPSPRSSSGPRTRCSSWTISWRWQSHARPAGRVQAGGRHGGRIGIAIEKGFQPGGETLRSQGYKLTSLAIVDYMDDEGNLRFRSQE